MTIVVIGESGLIGYKLVDLLRQNCLDVVSTSLTDEVNIITGEGLDEVLEDAEVVVDVTNSSSFKDEAALEFFQTLGQNLLAAEIKAGVKHHIALSVVGTERLQESGYFRTKLAQENLIRESPIPYTILRSTQFFEFLPVFANSDTGEEKVYVPPVSVQPIAADDVAATLADMALNDPTNGIVEIAGPERVNFAALVQRFLDEMGDIRPVIVDSNARYFGAQLNVDTLIPGENPRIGSQSFEEWLSIAKMKAFTPKAVQIVKVIE
ncbi:MAG: NAD(P)H-binding protein [Chloroflexi bacterium]|nr:NAD(P)H-binding protein [Chloroflexota bacterium]